MKQVGLDKVVRDRTADLLLTVLNSVPEIRFISKIDEALEKRGLTQGKLATLCGLRPTTVSEIINGSRSALTKAHIASIMIALRITDISEILNIEFAPETTEQFEKESKDWIENGVVPEGVREIYAKNAEAFFNPDISS